jgi:hypothetical protein
MLARRALVWREAAWSLCWLATHLRRAITFSFSLGEVMGYLGARNYANGSRCGELHFKAHRPDNGDKVREVIMNYVSTSVRMSVAIVSLVCAGLANADTVNPLTGITGVSGTVQIGGQPQTGANYLNFGGIAPTTLSTVPPTLTSPDTLLSAPPLTISILGNAAAVQGSSFDVYAQPYLSGNNDLAFGGSTLSIAVADPTTYLTSGTTTATTPGALTLAFSTPETYFGLLWGSVDPYNTLQFYDGSTLVDTVTGTEILAADASIILGDTYDAAGTAYVNIDTSTPFTSVVAMSGDYNFEIDDIAWGGAGVPDSGVTIALLGGALAGLHALRHRMLK